MSPKGAQHPGFLLQNQGWTLSPSPIPAGEGRQPAETAAARSRGPESLRGTAGRHEGPWAGQDKESAGSGILLGTQAPRGVNDMAKT